MLDTYAMRYGRYGFSYLLLRLGLGFTFLWIGADILRNPDFWINYLPKDIPFGLSTDSALRLGGGIDIAIGLGFISSGFTKIAALLATISLLVTLTENGITSMLVSNIGLLGATLSVLTWPRHRHKKRWWQKIGRKKKRKKVVDEDSNNE